MRTALVLSVVSVCLCVPVHAHATWDARFGGTAVGDPGFGDAVRAIANDGSTVYAAGGFWGVWWWNGAAWVRLGHTLANSIEALAVTSNHDIYAGGIFGNINLPSGTVPAGSIARWNGGEWTTLEVNGVAGVSNTVHSLAAAPNGTDVYIGGNFITAGGLTRNYATRWDGSTFHAVANNTFNGTVYEIMVDGNDVYFGGDFTLPFVRVAHYNGSSFEFINGGPNARVYGLAVYNGDLHVAGSFNSAGGAPAAGVARWDGSDWHAVATSLTTSYGGPLRSLTASGGYLYLTGGFSAINGVAASNVARWNGAGWLPLETGVSGGMGFASHEAGGSLWVGGDFEGAGAWPASAIARWSGSTWGFGGASDVVRDIAPHDGGAYVVGDFLQVAGLAANRVAFWDGNAWSTPGGGVDGSARCVAVSGSDVYVGGNFDNAGGVPAAGIARWNGGAWSALGNGLIGIPYDLEIDGSTLYVAGTVKPVATPYDNFVGWDGSAWHLVGGAGPDAAARCVVIDDGRIFIGGDFLNVGSTPASRVAMFDGVSWSALGGGLNGPVYSIAVDEPDVYVVGDFSTAGGGTANRIARWNGSQWLQVGTGLNGIGHRVGFAGGDLVVAGDFTTVNGASIPGIARRVGPSWTSLGGGANDRVLAMATFAGGVYVGGDFSTTGSVASDRIGVWHELFPTPVDGAPARALRLEQNAPNPFNPSTTIHYSLDHRGPVTLRVYDVRGALVRSLVDAVQVGGPHEATWDGRDERGRRAASGVYFCRLGTASQTRVIKMTVLK